jgi:hypothetical protein
MHVEPALSRLYMHPTCGGITEISGDDYVRLECPFRGCTGTFCTGCRKFVRLDAVVWDDSGEKISDYRKRVYESVSPWERVRLALFANAYEGALNLNLDPTGAPRPGPRTFDLDAPRTEIPPPSPLLRLPVFAGLLMFVLGWAACAASWSAQARWQKPDTMAEIIAMAGTFLWASGGVLAAAGLLSKPSPPESQ